MRNIFRIFCYILILLATTSLANHIRFLIKNYPKNLDKSLLLLKIANKKKKNEQTLKSTTFGMR